MQSVWTLLECVCSHQTYFNCIDQWQDGLYSCCQGMKSFMKTNFAAFTQIIGTFGINQVLLHSFSYQSTCNIFHNILWFKIDWAYMLKRMHSCLFCTIAHSIFHGPICSHLATMKSVTSSKFVMAENHLLIPVREMAFPTLKRVIECQAAAAYLCLGTDLNNHCLDF